MDNSTNSIIQILLNETFPASVPSTTQSDANLGFLNPVRRPNDGVLVLSLIIIYFQVSQILFIEYFILNWNKMNNNYKFNLRKYVWCLLILLMMCVVLEFIFCKTFYTFSLKILWFSKLSILNFPYYSHFGSLLLSL